MDSVGVHGNRTAPAQKRKGKTKEDRNPVKLAQ